MGAHRTPNCGHLLGGNLSQPLKQMPQVRNPEIYKTLNCPKPSIPPQVSQNDETLQLQLSLPEAAMERKISRFVAPFFLVLGRFGRNRKLAEIPKRPQRPKAPPEPPPHPLNP